MLRRVLVVTGALSLALTPRPGMPAEDRLASGTPVEFIVPNGSVVSPAELVVFIGPPDLALGLPGNCTSTPDDTGLLQEAILIDRGNRARRNSNLIVTSVDGVENHGAVPMGTRLGAPLVGLGTCGTTNEFAKYRGYVE